MKDERHTANDDQCVRFTAEEWHAFTLEQKMQRATDTWGPNWYREYETDTRGRLHA